jgi:leucine dehydrogenase
MVTAYGVYMGMKACINEVFDRRDFQGLKVAIQGAGKVGCYLIERLSKEGCKIILAERRERIAQEMAVEYGVDLVKLNQIYGVDCDIFSPCALGGVLNGHTIPRLKCKIVAGAANNQLINPQAGERLHKRGILYAPDYVINSGGLICVVMDREGSGMRHILEKTSHIYDTLTEVLRTSRTEHTPTCLIADRMAERRIIKARLDKERGVRSPRRSRAYDKRRRVFSGGAHI